MTVNRIAHFLRCSNDMRGRIPIRIYAD